MNAAALLALQAIDSELDALAGRRNRLAERDAVRDATAARDAVTAGQRRCQDEIAAAESEIERLEGESAAVDRSIARLEAQLKSVVVMREAEALTREIAALRAERSAHDDAELAALERQADADTELVRLAVEHEQVLVRLGAAEADLAAVLADLQVVEDEIRARRDAAAAMLDAAELQTYDTARARHGGVGFVSIEGRRCSGCHVDISPGELDAIKATPAGELPECPNCARHVVL